ncbi:Mitochondrial import inner membrane translocase subunit TIM44 [Armadillidium nasatum]|uniref:Mitochondrial import inner membrane translocase subunit TIM44 n=1 Tax=Armadillidium nasatum TaxID=96803 RepID=A0A5N5SJW3_9CRUS|nr:Mitochondrial import inner membrane translocase subunit TIM44 [Armadillidium nasatum]
MFRAVNYNFVKNAIYPPSIRRPNIKFIPLQEEHVKKYSASPPQKPSSFFGKLYENMRDEMTKNKKLRDSIKDFKKDMEKFEKSESLQKAREKYRIVEEETAEGSKKARMHLESIKQKEATKTAQRVTETLSQKGEEITKSQTYKTLSDTARAVREEIDQSTFGKKGRVYRPPEVLRLRVERDVDMEEKIIQANTEATGITIHKDSRFTQSWEEFKNNNPYINKVLEWRNKLDESDNPLVRASLLLKEKVSDVFSGVFSRTELSEALTEICKMDPNFDKERFLLECEFVLEDWCYERAFNILAAPVKQIEQLGFKLESKILDVDNVDLVMGKVMEEGPVLALSFQSQQIICVKNSHGEVVEGDPTKVMRVQYVWVLCRDMVELNPQAAWRLLDLSAQSSEQLV